MYGVLISDYEEMEKVKKVEGHDTKMQGIITKKIKQQKHT